MSDKIRVLHLASVVNKNDFVDSLVSNMDKDRFKVSVTTFTKEAAIQAPNYEAIGIKHHILNICSRKQYLTALRKLSAIISSEKIQILHTHMFDEAFLGAVLKKLHPKLCFVLGRHYSDEIYLTGKGWRRKRSLLVETFSNTHADKIVVVSSFIQNLLLKQNVRSTKLFKTTYGFDFTQQRYNQPSASEVQALRHTLQFTDAFVVLNIGRHYFLKGQDLLIKAFSIVAKEHSAMQLVLVGDGPWHEHLKQLASQSTVRNQIHFLGWRRDVPSFIQMADVVVQPTMTEAFPQIMVETMAQAKPLIISKVSGPDDQVKHKETGYLVEAGNLDHLIKALKYMYENAVRRKAIGDQASAYVRAHLDIKNVIKEYEALYMACSVPSM